MHTTKTIYLTVTSPEDTGLLFEKVLHFGWQLKALSATKEHLDFFDTFEWNAFDKEVVIVKTPKSISLVDLNTGQETDAIAFKRNPTFFSPADLPPGKLKERLLSYSDIRAFIKLCSITTVIQSYHILDNNEKTIGVLTSTSLCLEGSKREEPFASLLSLIPLRGYQDEIEKITHHTSLGTPLDFKELFLLIMTASGQNVQGYSSKISLSLDGESPIHESTQRLLQFTLSLLQKNEQGIKNNIDTEFLHDYRVAIRRARSILKQLKGVYEQQETAFYLTAFKELGKKTNQLRDSDVYLLHEGTYYN